ncbi:MAG: GNAT family N-acetyltransferase [Flammeovirgaceae bacterium]|nr:GNAT family N-acetyltransferase [Flammeovirgaceae bacterium]
MIIRKGVKKDIPQVLDLIKELAEFENAPDQVTNSIERLENDGFGNQPVYDLFVAESENKIIGMAITYFRYSTWKGKNLYIEDLVINEKFRREGIGLKIFEEVKKFAKNTSCVGISLQVLDWNKIGINFYKKLNMKFDKEWINCNLNLDEK